MRQRRLCPSALKVMRWALGGMSGSSAMMVPDVGKMILAITSKIVSLAEGRIENHDLLSKEALVRREADQFLGDIGYGCYLTIKEGLLIPSAGIDESNSANGDYILYPADPFASAARIWQKLREAWRVNDLGIILTDSHTMPLRRGVTGICLSHWGFHAVKYLIGTQDLFGRELRMTQMNLVDGLSAAAVMMMGEGQERQPLAILNHAKVEFCEVTDPAELQIPLEEDLYFPLLKPWLQALVK